MGDNSDIAHLIPPGSKVVSRYINDKNEEIVKVRKVSKSKLITFIKFLALLLITGGVVFGATLAMSGFSFFIVRGHSMEPTYQEGSPIVLRQARNAEAGQIIFFTPPPWWTEVNENLVPNAALMKRIVAAPGDRIAWNGEDFTVNDEVIFSRGPECLNPPKEDRVRTLRTQSDARRSASGYFGMAGEEFFVMGDATNSFDSKALFCNAPEAPTMVETLALIDGATVINYGEVIFNR